MRPSCPFCATKHISQAIVLLGEAQQGYPEHFYLALGHLAEASDELVQSYPRMADGIRQARKELEARPVKRRGEANNLMILLKETSLLAEQAADADEPSTGAPIRQLASASGKAFTFEDLGKQEPGAPLPCAKKEVPAAARPAVATLANQRTLQQVADEQAGSALPDQSIWYTLPEAKAYLRYQGKNEFLGTFIRLREAKHLPGQRKLLDHVAGVRITRLSQPGQPVAKVPCTSCAEKARQAKLERERAAKVLADAAAAGEEARKDPAAAVASTLVSTTPPAEGRNARLPALIPDQYRGMVDHALAHDASSTILIISTLTNFDPSYSLSTCIRDQAMALSRAGHRVLLVVQEGAVWDAAEFEGVHVLPVAPASVWVENAISDTVAGRWVDFFIWLFDALTFKCQTLNVISHDLLFQGWYTSAAKAIHWFSHDRLPLILTQAGSLLRAVQWNHLAHSSVGSRPQQADDLKSPIWWRTNLPRDLGAAGQNFHIAHRLVVLSSMDVERFAAYYGEESLERVSVVHNVRDPRSLLRLPGRVITMLNRVPSLLTSHAIALLPFSATRWHAKGVDVAIRFFAQVWQRMDKQATLVLACGHANGEREQQALTSLQRTTETAGMVWGKDVVCTASLFPETAAAGMSREEMTGLWRFANLFIFPTHSEAGSLVLLEAMAQRCVLVLNDSVPNLKDYTRGTPATFVPWPGIKRPPLNASMEEYEANAVAEVIQQLSPLQAGRSAAWAGGTWEQLAKEWEDVLLRTLPMM